MKTIDYIFSSCLFLIACSNTSVPIPDPQPKNVRPQSPLNSPLDETKPSLEFALPPQSCMEQLLKLKNSPIQERLKAFQKALPFIVSEAKVTPVIYLRYPLDSSAPKALSEKRRLERQTKIRFAIRELLNTHKNDKKFLREIFLPENYLFHEDSVIAAAMSQEIRLVDLFDEKNIYLLRHNKINQLVRTESYYANEEGKETSLYLNDRVATKSEKLLPPAHLDLNFVTRTTGAIRILPQIVDTSSAWIKIIFPSGNSYEAMLSIEDDKTVLSCIEGNAKLIERETRQALLFADRHARVVETALKLVDERPIFDEPKDEGDDVQEDGELRQAWKESYFGKKKKFLYREVEYDIFNRAGQPIPPQVCVDFILDTWERAFGTWYTDRSAPPTRTVGDIDFNLLNNFSRRHIASILTFSSSGDTPFERYDVPRKYWIPLENQRRFIKNLARISIHFQIGDLLVIHGFRDEDEQEHFHTVLILSTDPITGIPTEVADNQGRPRISTLKTSMRAAPRRSIKYRLRLNFDKIFEITKQEKLDLQISNIDTSY